MFTLASKYYDPKQKRVILISTRLLVPLKPRIATISIGDKNTTLKMAPEWFKPKDDTESLKNIVYPDGITTRERHTFDTVARYRAATGKPNNNFRRSRLNAIEENPETTIIMLDNIIQQYGGELDFSHEDLTYQNGPYRTACGVANMGSAHLLVNEYVPTANFCFLVNLDYESDLRRSGETMQKFILDFANAIAEVLACDNDYVRVMSLDKLVKTPGQTKVNFGVTTPNPIETENLANQLKTEVTKGFPKHRILKHVQPDDYDITYLPLINFFQLSPSDFDPAHDIAYKTSMPPIDRRGNQPYHLPIGWYRLALKVTHKFPDDELWLGKDNVEGEWPVAFHGTKAIAVKGITREGLRKTAMDAMREEAVKQGGKDFDQPGLYVATHCFGGAHPRYTMPFAVTASSRKVGEFRVVFQCRVKPGAYTVHEGPVKTGAAWRFVDPDAIRPYGILIKNEDTPDPGTDTHE